MTTHDLIIRRDHLAEHRRLIIGRSLAAAIASAIPIPILDARLSYMIQRGTLRQLALAHQVDIDEQAAERIIYGPSQPPRWSDLVGTTLAFKYLAKTWRKALIAYMAARRVQVAGRYFLTATLFDHYCSKLHHGLGLDGASGAELRSLMDEALAQTPGALSNRMFRRALTAAARATARAPLELLDIASRGALSRLISARSEADEVAVAEEIDTQLERQLRSQKTFLARAVTAIEIQLSVDQNPYIDELLDNFERIWHSHRESEP